jgi:hypothetical protein
MNDEQIASYDLEFASPKMLDHWADSGPFSELYVHADRFGGTFDPPEQAEP